MIEYVTGAIERLSPTDVTVSAGAIGYLVNISLNTYTALEGKSECRLWTHLRIQEDAWTLYGFATADERRLFRLLIGVSGVGAATARLVLSACGTSDLEVIIAQGDAKSLKSVKGVGGKTAERIIVDLRDKIKTDTSALSIQTPALSAVFDEALAALVMLGYKKPEAQKALKKLFDSEPSLRVEAAIKKALAIMK